MSEPLRCARCDRVLKEVREYLYGKYEEELIDQIKTNFICPVHGDLCWMKEYAKDHLRDHWHPNTTIKVIVLRLGVEPRSTG